MRLSWINKGWMKRKLFQRSYSLLLLQLFSPTNYQQFLNKIKIKSCIAKLTGLWKCSLELLWYFLGLFWDWSVSQLMALKAHNFCVFTLMVSLTFWGSKIIIQISSTTFHFQLTPETFCPTTFSSFVTLFVCLPLPPAFPGTRLFWGILASSPDYGLVCIFDKNADDRQ